LLPVLVVVGLIAAARLRWLPVGLVVTLAAATSAGVYLFLIDYAAPRFLLPAYGLLAIVVAAGAIWLTNRPRGTWRIAGFTVLAGGLVLHLASQVVIAT
jgi:hypothetical protein